MGGSILDQAYDDKRNAALDDELDALVSDYDRRNPPPEPKPTAPSNGEGQQDTPARESNGGFEKVIAAEDRREKKQARPYSSGDRASSLLSGDFGSYFDKTQISREIDRLYAERKKNGSAVTKEDLIALAESNYAQRQAALGQIVSDIPNLGKSGLAAGASGLMSATGMFAELVGDDAEAQELYAGARELGSISKNAVKTPDSTELAGIYDGLRSFAMVAPAAALAWKTKNPEVLLSSMFATAGGQANLDIMEKQTFEGDQKFSLAERLTYSVAYGGIEYWTEKVPAHILFGSKRGRGMLETVLKSLATEVPGEQAALAGQHFLEWRVLNPDVPFEDYYRNYPQQAYQTFIATITGTLLNNAGVIALDTAEAQINKGLEGLKKKTPDDPEGGETPDGAAAPEAEPADPGAQAAPEAEAGAESAPATEEQGKAQVTIAELGDILAGAADQMAAEIQQDNPPAESEDQKFVRGVEQALGIKRPAAPVETPEERRARVAERRAAEQRQTEESTARVVAGVRTFSQSQKPDPAALRTRSAQAIERAAATENSGDIAAAVAAYNEYAEAVGHEKIDPDSDYPDQQMVMEPISLAEEMGVDTTDRTSSLAEAERMAAELEAMGTEEAAIAAMQFRTLVQYSDRYDDNTFWQGFDEAIENAAPFLMSEEQQQAIVDKVAEAVEDAPLAPEEQASATIVEEVRATAPASRYFGRKSFGGEGLAAEAPAPETAPVARTSAKYQVETEDAGSFELTIIRLPDGSVGLIGPDINVNYVPAFAKGKTDQELMAYQFEPLGFKQATEKAGRPAAAPAPAAAPEPARLPPKPAPISESQLQAISAKEQKTARKVVAREAMALKAESVYDDVLSKDVLENLDDQFDMTERQVREVMGKALDGQGSLDRFNTLMKRYAKVRAELDREAAKGEAQVQPDFEALAAAQPDPGEGGLGRSMQSLVAEQAAAPIERMKRFVEGETWGTLWKRVQRFAGRDDASRRYDDAVQDAAIMVASMSPRAAEEALSDARQLGGPAEKAAVDDIRQRAERIRNQPEVKFSRNEERNTELEEGTEDIAEAVEEFETEWKEKAPIIEAWAARSNSSVGVTEPIKAINDLMPKLAKSPFFDEAIASYSAFSEQIQTVIETVELDAEMVEELEALQSYADDAVSSANAVLDGSTSDAIAEAGNIEQAFYEIEGLIRNMVTDTPELQALADATDSLPAVEGSQVVQDVQEVLAKIRRNIDELWDAATQQMRSEIDPDAPVPINSPETMAMGNALRDILDAFDTGLRAYSRPRFIKFSAGQTSKRKPVKDAEKNRKRLDARGYSDWGQNYLDLVQKGTLTYASAEEMQALGIPPAVNAATIRDGDKVETIINTSYVRPDDLEFILLHEIGVHRGLRGLIGEAGVERVLSAVDKLANDFIQKNTQGQKTTRAELDAYSARQRAILNAARPEQVREETLAYIVEDFRTNPFVMPFLTQMKVAIGRRFPGIIDRLGWGPAEYAQLALVAMRRHIIKELRHIPNNKAMPGNRSPRVPYLLEVTYPEGFRKLAGQQGSATSPQGWARRMMTMGQKRMWRVIRTLDLRNVDTFPQQLKDMERDLTSPEMFDAFFHLDPDFQWENYLDLMYLAQQGDPDAAYQLYDILTPLKGLDVPVEVKFSADGIVNDLPGSPLWEASLAKGLDMSAEARRARGTAAGFNMEETLYHGTGSDFAVFDLDRSGDSAGTPGERAIFLSANPTEASVYARNAAVAKNGPGAFGQGANIRGANVMPMVIRPGRQMVVTTESHPDLKSPDSEVMLYRPDVFADIIAEARAQGYDTVRFENVLDSALDPADQIAVLDPKDIRSVNAAFDPDSKASANVMFSADFETPGTAEYEAAAAKGLDMSAPARDARRKAWQSEAGTDPEIADTILYHGTGKKFSKFRAGDRGIFLGDKETASTYGEPDAYYIRGNLAPRSVLVQVKKEIKAAREKSLFGKLENERPAQQRELVKRLKAMGYDGYKQGMGIPGALGEVVIFDPANIRSVNAAFDPDQSASSNVMFSADFQDAADLPDVDPALEEVYFNFVRFGDPDTVHPTIREALKSAAVAKRMGPPMTLRQTQIDAANTNAFEAMVKSRKGETLSFAELTALRNLHKYSALKLKELADMANADPSDKSLEAAVMRASMFHTALLAEVKGQSAQAARTLNAMKIQAKATAAIVASVDAMLNDANGNMLVTGDLRRMIRDLAQMDASQIANINKRVEMSTWKAWQDLAGTWVRFMFLSAPPTHVVNALGNLTTIMGSIADVNTAGVITKDMDLIEEAGVRFDAMIEAFVHQFTYMKANSQLNPLKPNTSIKFDKEGVSGADRWEGHGDRALSAARMEKLSGGLIKSRSGGTLWDNPVGVLADTLGYALAAPSDAMGTSDDLFKGANFRISLRGQAFRKAREERRAGKITEDQEQARAQEIYDNPPDEMIKRAISDAQENTFTRPVGNLTKAAISFRSWLNSWTGIGGYILLPFIITPSNLISFRFRRLPTAPFFKEWRDAYGRGGKDRAVAIAQLTNGTSLLMFAGALAAAGLITGSGPDDPAKRKALMGTGWKPFAFNTPWGYVEMNRLDPLMMPFQLSAAMMEVRSNKGWSADPQDDELELALMSAVKFGQMMTDKTYLQGISNVIEIFNAPSTSSSKDRIGNYLNRTGAALTTPALLATIRRMEDPFKRHAFDVIDQIKNRVPMFSSTLPKLYDVLGREQQYQTGIMSALQIINPFGVSGGADEPIVKEFDRLKYIPSEMDYNVTIQYLGQSVDVSLRERLDIYSEMTRLVSGEELGMPRLTDQLNELIETDAYKQLSDVNDPSFKGSKAQFLSQIFEQRRKVARDIIMYDRYYTDISDMAHKQLQAQNELAQIKEAEATASSVTEAYQMLLEEAK